MTSDGQAVERLRDYLRTLKPEARAMLVAELERGVLSGEESAGNELILQELRRAIRVEGQPASPRMGDAARMFFAPVEPFLIDDAAHHKRAGRLSRVSLEPIWEWIGRDLIPAETKALSEDINRALMAKDRVKAEQRTRALHDRALLRIREAMASVTGNDKARRRLAVQVGTPRALEDLATLTGILANRDLLSELARRLPNHLRTFERDQIDSVKLLLEGAIAQKTERRQRRQNRCIPLRVRADHGPVGRALAAHSHRHPRSRDRRGRAHRGDSLRAGRYHRAGRGRVHGE